MFSALDSADPDFKSRNLFREISFSVGTFEVETSAGIDKVENDLCWMIGWSQMPWKLSNFQCLGRGGACASEHSFLEWESSLIFNSLDFTFLINLYTFPADFLL